MTTKGVFGQPGYDVTRMSKAHNVERDSERDENMHVDPFAGDLDRRDVERGMQVMTSLKNEARGMTDGTRRKTMAHHSTSLLRITLPLVLRCVEEKNRDVGGYFECRW